MARKFVIFYDTSLKPTIVLDIVTLHKEINPPEGTIGRAGGGYCDIAKDGTLVLSGDSTDFGKYSMKMADEAFASKRITLAEEMSYDQLGITDLITY